MRLSLKIREAKQKLDVSLESNNPLYFGNEKEYRDFVINQMIYTIHGEIKNETHLILYYEYKERFGQKIEKHYLYA